jgi:hypothetical protein
VPTFRVMLDSAGKNAAGFRVPAEVVAELGKGKRPPVLVTINGTYTYRNTVAVYGDEYLLGVSMANRAAAGVQAGEVIEVTLELDTAPRDVEVPEDLLAAFERAPAAQEAFEALSPSRKGYWTYQLDQAKTPETRARRVEKTIEALLGPDRGKR